MDEVQEPQAPQEDSETEQVANKITEELEVNLPGKNLPIPIRLIAFFTLIGGLSIVGSLFADIVRPDDRDLFLYALRTAVGILAVVIAYGMIKKQRWCLWLYGLLALISLAENPFLSFIPITVLIYLYFERNIFAPFILDILISNIAFKIKSKVAGIKAKTGEL
jgi:hypothetical protein